MYRDSVHKSTEIPVLSQRICEEVNRLAGPVLSGYLNGEVNGLAHPVVRGRIATDHSMTSLVILMCMLEQTGGDF